MTGRGLKEREDMPPGIASLQYFRGAKSEKNSQIAVNLFSLAVTSKHIDDFVLVEFFHLVAGWTAILAWVKFGRFLGKHLTNCSGEG